MIPDPLRCCRVIREPETTAQEGLVRGQLDPVQAQSHVSSVSLLGAILTVPLDVIRRCCRCRKQAYGMWQVFGELTVTEYWKTKGRRLSIYPNILHKNILSFLTSPVINDTFRAYRSRSA